MPRYPDVPGTCASVACSLTMKRSGVTISIRNVSAIFLCSSLHLLSIFENLIDGALHVEGLLGHIVVLAFDDLFEAADRVLNLNVASFVAGELLGYVEGLRQELLDLAGTGYSDLVV